MLSLRFYASAVVVVLLLTPCFANVDSLATLRIALAKRSFLPNDYHVEVQRNYSSTDSMSVVQTENTKLSIWVKDNLSRTDEYKISSSFDIAGVNCRSVVCRNCERPGYCLKTITGSPSNTGLVEFKRINVHFDKIDQWRIDWRGLGLLHSSVSGYASEPYTSTIDGLVKEADEKLEYRDYNGSKCVVATIVVGGDSPGKRVCFFRPDLGMSPVLFEDNFGGNAFSQRTEIAYFKLDNFDVWYPKSIVHVRSASGKEIVKETLTLTVAQFAAKVPSSVFTLAGLALESQQPVAFPEIALQKDYPVWRNGMLDRDYTAGMQAQAGYELSMRQLQTQPVPDALPFMDRNRWLYFASGGTLLILAITLVKRVRKSGESA